ncbi:MAG: mannonate dehydratase, partial [Rhodobacteraceae bacterium]|nr:mannonate dehydratase [Paracoccaceae bacterium]
MMESWRWFGPLDSITLDEVAQTRATGVVTALHEIPYGEVWGVDAIRTRQRLIARDKTAGLVWNVVESLPLHEDIKRGTGNLDCLFANYRQSLQNLAKCGVKVVCYNFMPLLDWTRTQLDAPLPGG